MGISHLDAAQVQAGMQRIGNGEFDGTQNNADRQYLLHARRLKPRHRKSKRDQNVSDPGAGIMRAQGVRRRLTRQQYFGQRRCRQRHPRRDERQKEQRNEDQENESQTRRQHRRQCRYVGVRPGVEALRLPRGYGRCTRVRLYQPEEDCEHREACNAGGRGNPSARGSPKTPRAQRTGNRKKDGLVFLDCQDDRGAYRRPNDRPGIERVERPGDGRRSKTVFMKIPEDQTGERGIQPDQQGYATCRAFGSAMSAKQTVNRRSDERAGDGLQRDQRQRRMPEEQYRAGDVQDGRKMKRPVTAFDWIAEAAKRTRRRLREDAKVHEVAVDEILERTERGENDGIRSAADPQKTIAHGRARYPARGALRCWRYAQRNGSMSPSSTAPTLPVSSPVR